jgi:subtilisin family serine protease
LGKVMMRRSLPAILVLLAVAAAASAAPFVPNDPYYAPYEWYGPVLNLPEAWGYSLGSSQVIAAVLDTGVIATTPDLAGRLLPPLSATSDPDPLDGTTNHHGTWVASVLGMTVNNGVGGAGVGNFSILPITVTDPLGSNRPEWLARGIDMAVEAGARVINISHSTLDYTPLDQAAARARQAGALVFVAAGNSNAYNGMQGFDNLIFVSATQRDGGRWSEPTIGSSYGPYVDLAAPGDDILIADPADPLRLPSGYGKHHGTSFASPLAAGAAALAWSINPDLTADQVLQILYDTAVGSVPGGRDDVFGFGLIDVGAVAEAAYALAVPDPATLSLLGVGAALLVIGRRRRG